MNELDLTPFGFTPTETAVYKALLELGPSGGYQLSNELGVARANIYQALKGLVQKEAAVQVGERPASYRAVGADAVFALVANDQASRLDALERQLRGPAGRGQPTVVAIDSPRAITQIVTHRAAVSADPCRMVGPEQSLRELQPVWRKRLSEGIETSLWSVEADVDLDVALAGTVGRERCEQMFGGLATVCAMPSFGLAVLHGEKSVAGYWSDDPILVGCFAGAIAALTT